MRYLKYLSLPFAALLLLSSCSQPVQKDSIDKTTGSTTDNINITEATDNISVTGAETDKPKPWEEDMNYSGGITKVTQELSEYNGEELTLTIKPRNNGQSYEQGFILYVNGERNDFSTDEYPDKKPYHVYNLPEGGSIEVTLHFTPYNCKKGEKAIVNVVSMITPNYMLEDYFYVSFGVHHGIACLWPYELTINQDAPESEYHKISTDSIKTEMTEEYEKKYIEEDSDGEMVNILDEQNFFSLYQEEGVLESYYITENDLTLNISACGKGGKFLVGIYVNHELQKAFGDNYYALCEVDREHLTKITANIDVSKLSGLNHVYMIAAPYDPDNVAAYVEKGERLEKNDSRLLIIGDKDEIEAEMERVWEEREDELTPDES